MGKSMTATAFARGLAAYNRGDYQTAMTQWLPLAEGGHAVAMANVGIMFARGSGVGRDEAAAARFCRGAAERGDPTAQCNLGQMYAKGLGVTQDYREALKWYYRAAEQDDRDAQFNLGLMLARGDAGEVDLREAHMWLELAADSGDIEAIEGRNLVAMELTPAELAQSRLRAHNRKVGR